MRKWIPVILVLLAIAAGTVLLVRSRGTQPPPSTASQPSSDVADDIQPPAAVTAVPRSMYSWEDEVLSTAVRADMLSVVHALGVTDWYQSFGDEQLYNPQTQELLHQLHNMGTNTYYLAGVAEWGLDASAAEMLRVVDRVAAYNRAHADGEQLRGIVFDVEPYLTDEWDEDPDGVMESYLPAVKATYEAAKQQELTMVLCIPGWYDRSYSEELEQLIAEGCDIVAVMNYNRSDEVESIRTETELARKQGKAIECIFEFQKEGKHSLTENETYSGLGLAAARESYQHLADELDYDKLSLSYHYYKPVLELYKQ